MKSLNKLKAEIKDRYQSSFNFETFEIEKNVKDEVIKREANIFKNFKKYSDSLYEICQSLYEVSILLKGEGTFMAWYQNIGLTSDKVSELLKRWQLYINLPDKKDYITSLSGQAVKVLTHKKNTNDKLLLELATNNVKKVDEIKKYISVPPIQNVFDAEVIENNQIDINNLKNIIHEKELELKELKNKLKIEEEKLINKNNLKITY